MHLVSGTYWYVHRTDGKNVWEKLGRDYGAALAKWAQFEGEAPEQGRTIERAIAHYLETERHRLRPSTLVGYQRSAARLIPIFGRMAFEDLTPNHVYEYLRRCANVQANRDKALLSAVYSALPSWGWYRGDNPCTGVRRNPEHARKRYIAPEELGRLTETIPPKLARIARWAYLTGMRLSDILALQIRNATNDGVEYVASKNGAAVMVEWSDELRALWREATEGRIGAQPVFPGRGRAHYTLSGFETVWQRAKKTAGVKNLHFHDIRGTAASDADNDEHARALLGHEDVRTTRRHYRSKPERVKPIR